MTDRLKVVALGGGTGLATLLRALKHHPINLAAVVTMTDNGASSGRLSRELGTLPPGDVRKCLAALANDETLLTQLFDYRFNRGRGINGHSLGNLLLLALADITGSFDNAVEACSKILSIKGQVIPSTLDHVSIVAELANGQRALGEVDIPVMGHRFGIDHLELLPEEAKANPNAVRFIDSADLIIVGPGSLLTSVIPNFLIKEIGQAYSRSKAFKLFICNVSTERGETENFSVDDHIRTIQQHVHKLTFDAVLVNDNIVSLSDQEGKLGSIRNITTDQEMIRGIPVIRADVIDEQRPLYHDPKKLAEVVWRIIAQSLTESNAEEKLSHFKRKPRRPTNHVEPLVGES